MSTDVINPPNLPKQPKLQKEKKAKKPSSATGTSISVTKDNNKPAEQFKYVFGVQEEAIHDWMRCIFNPDDYQARVPNATGGFELYTELWRTKSSGTAVAAADGTAAVGVVAHAWTEDSNYDGVPRVDTQILGYTTPGRAVLSTDGTVSSATLPFSGANAATAGFNGSPNSTAPPFTLSSVSRVRLVAMILKIHTVLAANTAKGEIMVAGSVNPAGDILGGVINGMTWEGIKNTNEGVMTRAIRSIPNWQSGEVLNIVAIPAEQQAFEMTQPPAAGYGLTLVPLFSLVGMARGMTAGDSFSYDVTFVWESELGKSNRAESDYRQVVPVDHATLDLSSSKMRPYATLGGISGAHALPYVETLATMSPQAVQALAAHQSMAAVGHKRPVAAPIAFVPHPTDAAPSSFLGKLFTAGKDLLKGVAQSGILTNIPVVGNVLNTVANGLSSLFGK